MPKKTRTSQLILAGLLLLLVGLLALLLNQRDAVTKAIKAKLGMEEQ
jgi:hypothetical protein